MAKIDYASIQKQVLEFVGGKTNVESFTNCQTRLRINVKDLSKVDKEKLKTTEGALGINISGTQVQIIYGTGKVIKAAQAFEKISNIKSGAMVVDDLKDVAQKNKAEAKANNTSAFQRFIGKFAGIFAPLILGFIGAGILSGIAGIIKSAEFDSLAGTIGANGLPTGAWSSDTAHSWCQFFDILLSVWKVTFLIIVGWRTSEAFGGSGVIGAIIAGLYLTLATNTVTSLFIADPQRGVNILGFHIENVDNWFVRGFRPSNDVSGTMHLGYASGSIFGVMISAGLVGIMEKGLRKFIPSVIDTVATPTLTLLGLLVLNFILIIPVSGYLFNWVSFAFENLYANPLGAAVLSGIFLITVVFGIHQGFVPIYAALMSTTGVNGLFPVLAMAGAGQVGTSMALWLRAEKGGVLRKQIQGAIIPGFLGIGEPLLYGVTLPRMKPFITASIGGAVGGFFIGAVNLWAAEPIGLNTMFGPSGLLAIPLMTTTMGTIWKGILIYLSGQIISYGAGFAVTYFFGYKGVDLA